MSGQEALIQDIVNWKTEESIAFGEEFQNEEEYREMLQEMSLEELKQHWRTTVGEWLTSRSDLHGTFIERRKAGEFDGDFEDFVEAQLDKVIAGESTDYGYSFPT